MNINDISKVMCVNKQLKHNCEEYFRQTLRKMKYITEQQFYDVENTDYGKIYRQIYNRDVLFTNIQQFPIDKNRSQKKLYNIGIKKFSIGTKFTAFLTHENDLYFCKTSEYFSNDEDFEYIKRINITKFSTSPRNFMYLNEAGTVHFIFYEETKPSKDLKEIILQWTIQIPVKNFKASYGMATFLIKESPPQRPKFSLNLSKLVCGSNNLNNKIGHNEQTMVDDTQLNIVVFNINDLIPEDVNNPVSNNQRMKRINEYPFNDTLSFAVGYHQLLLVGLDSRLYQVDLSNYTNIGGIQPNILPAKLHEGLSQKHIVKVFSGFASFFAYEREEIPPINQWSTEQVMEFLGTFEEFQDYINIVKYEGIKGSDLCNITKKFMKDRLGLIRDDIQLKLQIEINKCKEKTYKPQKLYGWGKNDQGQLGSAKCTNIVTPIMIDIPQLTSTDEIDFIQIGWKNSIMVTKEKRFFITENRERKIEKKVEKSQDEQEEKDKNNKSKNSQKSTRNNISPNKSISLLSLQQEEYKSRWIEITDKFTELKDQRKYQIIEVSCSKDTVCVLGNCYDNKKLSQHGQEQEAEDDETKKKLTPVLSIFNRIRWDPSFNQSEFKILYQDKYLKDLELDFKTFEVSEVKSYRITQIKRNEKVVWDRESKFENFS